MKFENTEVWGFEHSLRGMRNPMNSWLKSDSGNYDIDGCYENCPYFNINCHEKYCDGFKIGQNDMKLAQTLIKAGNEHRKFMRQVFVSVDITAPLYWWKEFDTYKVGTVANSTSTMHKIAAKEFTLDDFSHEHLDRFSTEVLGWTIKALNGSREDYMKSKSKDDWWQMIQLLPSSYNQRRTIDLNFEVLLKQYRERKNHKLDEWHIYCDWIKEITLLNEIIKNYGY